MSDTLSAAAAAALGVQPPQPRPNRLAWVDVEDVPQMVLILDPGDPDRVLGQVAVFEETLPLTDQMADYARTVCDAVDTSTCEAENCLEVRATGNAPIGWVLAGDADERMEWCPMTLIQCGQKVTAVCPACSPSAQYPRL